MLRLFAPKNTLKAKLLVVLLGVFILMGCSATFRDSGIPWAFESDQLIHEVGAAQGVNILSSGRSGGRGAYSVFIERQCSIMISSGTALDLFEVLRTAVTQEIESRGAKIRGKGHGVIGEDARSFSYEYTWRGNAGFVRGYVVSRANGHISLLLLCYEHRK